MKLTDIFSSYHDENNEFIDCMARRDLIKKNGDLVKIGVDSSQSIVIALSLALSKLRSLPCTDSNSYE